MREDRTRPTSLATFAAMSKDVGNSSFVMKELTDGNLLPLQSLPSLDRWQHTQYFVGMPGPWICLATIKGNNMMGPCIKDSISSKENGPDM
jgi:hypothetical protein